MSVVDWATALVLLLVALAGLYSGVQVVLRRQVTIQGEAVGGWGAGLFALLYLLGGAVAAVALALMLREQL